MAMASNEGKRLIVFPAPMPGHTGPMLHLANLLHCRGFSITVIYVNFMPPNVSQYPQFTFRPIDHDGSGLPPPSMKKDVVPNAVDLPLLVKNCIEPFCDCLNELLTENSPYSCLIVDALWPYTSLVANNFHHLPMIALWTQSISTALVDDALPLFWDKGYFDLNNLGSEELEAWVPEYPLLKFKDIDRILAHHPKPLYDIISKMMNEMRGASAIIWNTCKELEPAQVPIINQNYPNSKNFFVGPIHKYNNPTTFSISFLEQVDPTIIPWLDSKPPKSVVYVSFGSMPHMPVAEFLELAWGLANSMQYFLWVIRPGSVNGYEWIEALPDGFMDNLGGRGHIVKWAPQQQVLAHPSTAVFLTHNGWNSTVESVSEGVPMICSFGILDQPINSRYVIGVWKVGVGLEKGLDREEIKSAVTRMVLVDKEGQEIRQKIIGFKEIVNQSVIPNGSSYQQVDRLVHYISSL